MTLLGDVSLLMKEWPFCRKYVTVGVVFEVSDVEARPNVAFISAAY